KSPDGQEVVIQNFKDEQILVNSLKKEIKSLIHKDDIDERNMLILLNSQKSESSLSDLKNIGNYKIQFLRKNVFFKSGTIHWATIDSFKGLEKDIIFKIDTHKISAEKKRNKLYTQISRAIHKVYIYSINSD
ncbi:uncharacterized protein METZ01_LOCUS378893, partial [marine metagenome]